jgi:hypothetical protein
MQTDISKSSFRHQCDLAAAAHGVELSELLTWNPELGNDTEASSCGFQPGVRYCGRFYKNLPPAAEVGPSFEYPLRVRLVQRSNRAPANAEKPGWI